jgi:hypothetical protein
MRHANSAKRGGAGQSGFATIRFRHCTGAFAAAQARASNSTPPELNWQSASTNITISGAVGARWQRPAARAKPLPRRPGSFRITVSAPARAASAAVWSMQLSATTKSRSAGDNSFLSRSRVASIFCSSLCAGINTAMEGRRAVVGNRRSDEKIAAPAWTAKAIVARIKPTAASSSNISGIKTTMAEHQRPCKLVQSVPRSPIVRR